jgi:hypothetical protein
MGIFRGYKKKTDPAKIQIQSTAYKQIRPIKPKKSSG